MKFRYYKDPQLNRETQVSRPQAALNNTVRSIRAIYETRPVNPVKLELDI